MASIVWNRWIINWISIIETIFSIGDAPDEKKKFRVNRKFENAMKVEKYECEVPTTNY